MESMPFSPAARNGFLSLLITSQAFPSHSEVFFFFLWSMCCGFVNRFSACFINGCQLDLPYLLHLKVVKICYRYSFMHSDMQKNSHLNLKKCKFVCHFNSLFLRTFLFLFFLTEDIFLIWIFLWSLHSYTPPCLQAATTTFCQTMR